jgi:hypothetical protein
MQTITRTDVLRRRIDLNTGHLETREAIENDRRERRAREHGFASSQRKYRRQTTAYKTFG